MKISPGFCVCKTMAEIPRDIFGLKPAYPTLAYPDMNVGVIKNSLTILPEVSTIAPSITPKFMSG